MRLSWLAFLLFTYSLGGCSGDEVANEPVAATSTDSVIPDAPGSDQNGAQGASSVNPDATGQPVGEKAQNTAGQTTGATGGAQMIVTSGGLNVRSGPGMQHKSVRVLSKGTKISIESCNGHWCRIAEGEFVAKKFLSESI